MRENDCIITCSICMNTQGRESKITFDLNAATPSGSFKDVWYHINDIDICPDCRWIYEQMLYALTEQQRQEFTAHFEDARREYRKQYHAHVKKRNAQSRPA